MIAYDQVVSGGSAECTTKMAAAPAADSVYSLPGFSTFSSLLLLVSFFFLFYLPLPLLPLITPYLVPFFCTLPIPFVSIFPLSRLAPCSEGRLDAGEHVAGQGERCFPGSTDADILTHFGDHCRSLSLTLVDGDDQPHQIE